MNEFRVRVKKTGVIRTVTRQAYMAMGPKVYEKIGEIDATVTPEQKPITQVHRTVSAPVIRPQIVKQEQAPAPEAEAEVTAEATPEVVVKRKPGRPAAVKSISSNSTEDEK